MERKRLLMEAVNGWIVYNRLIAESGKIVKENDHSLDKVYHATVKKVTNDIETLGFNTAISQMMIFVNECYKAETVYEEYAKGICKTAFCICSTPWRRNVGRLS